MKAFRGKLRRTVTAIVVISTVLRIEREDRRSAESLAHPSTYEYRYISVFISDQYSEIIFQ
ncbi:hypothetical protein PNP85_14290 [Halobacterium salinarum]|uniref:hypothetical protein n=1 Tax=Halobacterium salinarum TaxID=2242 RepID=UPI0025562878|nr:hypothetical protein [Halobacterium salinarum]MDL0140671.1 hypothetical protein [Halobacterium salinarum]